MILGSKHVGEILNILM